MSKLLFDEHPLVILPELAVRIGLNEAIVLQQIHYWIQKSDHLVGGVKWVYNTVEEWSKQFPFFSPSTVRRTLEKLELEGYVITGNHNRLKMDKTKWYSINYAVIESMQESPIVKSDSPSAQIEQMESPKVSSSTAQIEQMQSPKLSKAIPETTQKLSQENTTTTTACGDGGESVTKLTDIGQISWFLRAQWGAQGNIGYAVQTELMMIAREIGLDEMDACIKIVANAPSKDQSVRYLKGVIAKRAAERVSKSMQETAATVSNTSGMIHFSCSTCGREAQIQVAELVKHRGKTFGCEGCETRHSVDKYLGEVAA
jgi:DNA-binding PadR family transcriptional regulator/predicted RNA-binding Zn-ribbon protein involved in translation (DUF1610 family)